MNMFYDMPPYGVYAPTPNQARFIRWSRSFDPGPLSKLAASFCKRLLFPSLSGPLDIETWGLKTRIDPRKNITEKRLMFSPSRFELEEREILATWLKKGDVFVDVGANVGAYSLWAGQFIGQSGRIVAIEPQPGVLGRLRANFALNPHMNTQVFACGAGAAHGLMYLSIGSNNEGGASLATISGGRDEIEVIVRPLLSIVEEARLYRIDALKIDIEGFEDRAMIPFYAEAPSALHPRLLIIERGEKDWVQDLMGVIEKIGYRLLVSTKRNHVFELGTRSD
ncbi:FkbM family methyltransferase [Candidatus Phycosocius spiralis]|uniref:Methyltransferase n=1 Tax=Candidatus Phycosocius spiralis TaxID=2815099 RepID=A0ABQ4PUL0_9PROT|nr:FkbM family methyltransferase [Candidatus Phycosocius spiralis]GIU66664.1 methyltransferase [Candidatus Phycosocius spiralis]